MFGHLVSHNVIDLSVTVVVNNMGVSQNVSWYLLVWVTHQSMYLIVSVSQSVSLSNLLVKLVGWQCFSLSVCLSVHTFIKS